MKAIIILGMISMAAAVSVNCLLKGIVEDVVEEVDFYTTLDDNLDIDSIIENPEKFQTYIDCFKGVKPCSDLANSYKVLIPESLEQSCKRCNPAQKHLVRRFIEGLKEKAPKDFEEIIKIYDPENKYIDALEAAVQGF